MPFERQRLSGASSDEAHYGSNDLKEDYLWI